MSAFTAACAASHDPDMAAACARARRTPPASDAGARAFLEANLLPEPIPGDGLLTAYFSPVYEARTAPEPPFPAPLRTRPSAMDVLIAGALAGDPAPTADPGPNGPQADPATSQDVIDLQPDRAAIEAIFADYLGVRHVVWLGRGIDGDDTHGHVDDLSRFVDPHTVVTVVEPQAGDPNHEPLQENIRRLKDARDQDGQPLRVVELPMPRPVIFDGQRLPASYANFYIANGLVLVPTFNDPADRIALETLARLFPDREVVGIHAADLVWGLGTLHCMTQQQPTCP